MMRTVVLCLGLMMAVFGVQQDLAQEKPKDLSPSEAYKAAIAPFNAARSQENDLTDADKVALGIGITEASRDCLSLTTDTSAFATDAKELFALGQLCIFGQQFEAARGTLVEYLALPQPPERKQALLLLVRALLGLRDPRSAEPQVRSLLRDYPYDAQIHFAIDQVIDAAEGSGPRFNDLVLPLCSTQDAATIPLLSDGKALEGKDGNASAKVLFTDAVRCAALAELAGKAIEQGSLQQLATIVQQPSWAGTADLSPMQAALQRQQMVGVQAPIRLLRGLTLSANTLVPRSISLTRRTVLLIPFTLWSPSIQDVVRDLARFAPQQPIVAVTSWSANTGREDVPSSEVTAALHLWQREFPPRVTILIVPNKDLKSFYADSFPAGILIRDGVVRLNAVLSGQGPQKLLVNMLVGGAVH